MELERPDLSPLERIRKLDDERERIFSEAKSEALAKAHEAIAELNALGFSYDLLDAAAPKRKPKRHAKGGPCAVCEFETTPPHDRRKHRSQGEHKAPFTADELADLGLARVA
jgi:hypothetical protein